MNGNPTGLEPADPSRAVDATYERDWNENALCVFQATEKALESIGEYKAAREVGDAIARLVAKEETRAAGERQRGRQSLHGQNSAQAQVDIEDALG